MPETAPQDDSVAPMCGPWIEVPARPLTTYPPEYSDAARTAGIEGQVIVQVWVTAQGVTRDVRLLRGVHSLVDEAAVTAVRRWTFSPAEVDGRPVDVWVTVPVRFRLDPPAP